jgi:hypothetical protein
MMCSFRHAPARCAARRDAVGGVVAFDMATVSATPTARLPSKRQEAHETGKTGQIRPYNAQGDADVATGAREQTGLTRLPLRPASRP